MCCDSLNIVVFVPDCDSFLLLVCFIYLLIILSCIFVTVKSNYTVTDHKHMKNHVYNWKARILRAMEALAQTPPPVMPMIWIDWIHFVENGGSHISARIMHVYTSL
eukprot:TRINITY_DN45515_c0_g1_i1.p1 TRINITY_DN45515_c0_g1~~TRINITY_DN45515_c0_g1_i1.p1  ORF type:complete len:106 (-),score=4.60 TRINITY_DN45515_c0_g1_i1:227-544(-)